MKTMASLLKSPVILLSYSVIFNLWLVGIQGQDVTTIVGSPCNKTAQCSSTCGKIIFCEDEAIPNEGVSCPASHPHCVSDVRADRCSNMPDPMRPECSNEQASTNDFFCTDVGYFPDPNNCQRYYICSYDSATRDIIPHSYSCPSNHIFNYVRNRECYRYINPPSSICPNITCNGQTSAYAVAFPRDASFYYFCMPHPMIPGDNVVPIMFRCDDGWTFNGRKCVYNCVREGRFSVVGSDTSYYECSNVNGRLTFSIESCPTGFKFMQNIGYCQLQ